MRLPSVASLAVVSLLAAHPVAGSGASQTLAATATFGERTAVRVSRTVLTFTVPPGAHEASDEIEFSAAARTRPDANVQLVVETGGVAGPHGGPNAGVIAIDSPGKPAIELQPGIAMVAEQWTGGGVRAGTLRFVLRDVPPGTYTVPLRITVSVP